MAAAAAVTTALAAGFAAELGQWLAVDTAASRSRPEGSSAGPAATEPRVAADAAAAAAAAAAVAIVDAAAVGG